MAMRARSALRRGGDARDSNASGPSTRNRVKVFRAPGLAPLFPRRPWSDQVQVAHPRQIACTTDAPAGIEWQGKQENGNGSNDPEEVVLLAEMSHSSSGAKTDANPRESASTGTPSGDCPEEAMYDSGAPRGETPGDEADFPEEALFESQYKSQMNDAGVSATPSGDAMAELSLDPWQTSTLSHASWEYEAKDDGLLASTDMVEAPGQDGTPTNDPLLMSLDDLDEAEETDLLLDERAASSQAGAASHSDSDAVTYFDDSGSSSEDDEHEELPEEAPPQVFVMPPSEMPQLAANVSNMSIKQLCSSDEVYNIELAWLAFNWRVLIQASLESTPLYERLRFVAISASNLDEFFAKRVGGLMRQRDAGTANLKSAMDYRWTPAQQLRAISEEVKVFTEESSRILHDQVLPALAKEGLRILEYDDLNEKGIRMLQKDFCHEVELMLTPIKLDPGHPFPYLPSGSLNLAVLLADPRRKNDSRGRVQHAIINIPSSLPRWISVDPKYAAEGVTWEQGFVPSERVIISNLKQLFGGIDIRGVFPFRIARNAELARHEEDADDLLDMISDELRERRLAPFVRLEVESSMPTSLTDFLAFQLELDSQHVYKVNGILDAASFINLPIRRNDLPRSVFFPPWSPQTHPDLASPHKQRNLRRKIHWTGSKWKGIRSIFSIIRDGDILVHHPYHSFATSTQRLVEEAARDPRVLAIKSTLYRTSADSPIIDALRRAAENGKQVAVLVELKARFDEARNVGFAQKLEEAGCNVAYGLVGLKTHCKTTLVVRREHGNKLRTYCHIGTGNYNPSTAGVYTDLGLLTCDPAIGADVVDLFKHLTGLHNQRAVGGYRKLLVASEYMRDQFLAMIDAEIAAARAGRPAAFCLKLNGLDDAKMCAKIYEAAAAGVRVDLIVRGVCRVRPGVPGRSDNVRVVSVLGRFLEHHRIYCFYNGGATAYYIGSADWLPRNLMKRVEVAVPIANRGLKRRLRSLLSLYLYDPRAWEMTPEGRYISPAVRTDEAHLSAPLLDAAAQGAVRPEEAEESAQAAALAASLGVQTAIQQMTIEAVSKADDPVFYPVHKFR